MHHCIKRAADPRGPNHSDSSGSLAASGLQALGVCGAVLTPQSERQSTQFGVGPHYFSGRMICRSTGERF